MKVIVVNYQVDYEIVELIGVYNDEDMAAARIACLVENHGYYRGNFFEETCNLNDEAHTEDDIA